MRYSVTVRCLVAIFIFALLPLPWGIQATQTLPPSVQSPNKSNIMILTCNKPAVKIRHVCGVVLDGKTPVAGATVSILEELDRSEIQKQETGPSGRFAFNDLGAGTYWLQVGDASGRWRVRRRITLFKPKKFCEREMQFAIYKACE